MKAKLYSLISLILVVALVSCKSASKLYQKGNYDEAVEVAAKKLQKDPNDQKLRAVIQDAYRYAVNDHNSRIRNYSESNNELKYEWMHNEYASLQNLYNAIYRSPAVYELVKPEDYSSYITTYAERAAEVRYNRGKQWMENADKESYKKAYREFQAAICFKPGDMQIKHMLDESFNLAVTRVIIMPVDNYGYSYSSYNNELRNIDDALIRNLRYNVGNEFVKFYSSWDASREDFLPDQVVELRFSRFNIGNIRDNRSIREVSKQVVVKETVYRPDSIVKEYATVKARITTTTRQMYSEGNLNISIRDNNGRWLWNDNLSSGHNWSTTFTSYTGDERALSDDDKKQLNHRMEDAPREYEIIRCIKENISNDLLYKLRNYYSRY